MTPMQGVSAYARGQRQLRHCMVCRAGPSQFLTTDSEGIKRAKSEVERIIPTRGAATGIAIAEVPTRSSAAVGGWEIIAPVGRLGRRNAALVRCVRVQWQVGNSGVAAA